MEREREERDRKMRGVCWKEERKETGRIKVWVGRKRGRNRMNKNVDGKEER